MRKSANTDPVSAYRSGLSAGRHPVRPQVDNAGPTSAYRDAQEGDGRRLRVCGGGVRAVGSRKAQELGSQRQVSRFILAVVWQFAAILPGGHRALRR